MTDTKPKPCPFCGSEAVRAYGNWVGCDDCDAEGPISRGGCPVEAWNTAPRGVPAGLVGELVEALEEYVLYNETDEMLTNAMNLLKRIEDLK